jgi:hypothetical protein
VDTGSREENASKQESRALVLIQSEPKLLYPEYKGRRVPAAFCCLGCPAWNAILVNFVAMQPANCCYANKSVVAGIWYT